MNTFLTLIVPSLFYRQNFRAESAQLLFQNKVVAQKIVHPSCVNKDFDNDATNNLQENL